MDDEITLIWRSADTIPKFLYFVSRYLGLAVQACLAFTLFPAYCVNFMVFNTATLFVLMLSVELSLMLRLYALYGRNRIVFYILVFSIIGEIAAVFAMDITAFPQFYHLAIHYPSDWPVRGCFYPEVLSFFKMPYVRATGRPPYTTLRVARWHAILLLDTRHSSTVYHRATCLEHFPRGLGRYLGIRYTLLFGLAFLAQHPITGRRTSFSASDDAHAL